MPDFSVWQKNQFVTKSDRYSREFILKLIFIYGPHIKDSKPVIKSTWEALVADAREKRLKVNDVVEVKWDDIKIPITWWWKKLHEGSEKNKEKNRKLHEDFLIEATSFWRLGLVANT